MCSKALAAVRRSRRYMKVLAVVRRSSRTSEGVCSGQEVKEGVGRHWW
jgi:hypothetical protein